jgi:hypothetical protein
MYGVLNKAVLNLHSEGDTDLDFRLWHLWLKLSLGHIQDRFFQNLFILQIKIYISIVTLYPHFGRHFEYLCHSLPFMSQAQPSDMVRRERYSGFFCEKIESFSEPGFYRLFWLI